MKKIILSFIVPLCTLTTWAASFEVNGISYNVLEGNNVEVTYPGGITDYEDKYYGSVAIPETVTYDGTTYSVTRIGNGAFWYSGLTSITIPNSVTSISRNAFEHCPLESVVWNAKYCTDAPFYGNCHRGITSFTFGDGVECIPANLCKEMSKLTSITIPNSVTSVGDSAFFGCSGLTSPVYNSRLFVYLPTSFVGIYVIPDGIKEVVGSAFHECDNLTSIITPNSVTSIGNNAFRGCSGLTSITIPNSVTSIGNSAFYGCSGLTSITIPNSVTSIGEWAFGGCTGLTSVVWNAKYCYCTDAPFYYIESQITSFTFGDSVEHIPAYLCRNMDKLTSVTIPNSVTSIGEWAFGRCTGLASIIIPNSVTSIGSSAFNGCTGLASIIIPNSVTSIGEEAFMVCSSLTSITIPNSVTYIGGGMFYGCSKLKSVVLSNNITSLPSDNGFSYAYGVFEGCSSLTSITIPNSVTSIGNNAFRGCLGLTSITIPNSVTSIGERAFRGCSGLTSIIIPNSVTSIGYYAFSGCSGLASIIIPNSVTSIGWDAFNGCTGLASIIIPNSVTTIGWNAFRGCSGLTSITIPNSVTSIGYGAFADCSKLGKVILGSGLTEIEEDAFGECKKLYDIYCYAVEPPVAYISTFANYNVNLYIPCNNLKAYQMDALFGSFKYIQCIDSEDVTTNEVVITPGTTDVTITWPAESNADTYTLVIMKDGEVVCTLTFNSEGQLLNIAFAPGREGNHPAQYAEQSANGYRFTVTGLEEGTHYTYNIDIKNAANKTIKSHSGKFTTESLTAVENTHSKSPMTNCPKLLRNGQLIIIRDGVEYNAQGTVVK